MKKHNKMYACPMAGGECLFIIAKSESHFKKIYEKIPKICYGIDEFECWGKLSECAKRWEVKLKSLIEKSGVATMDCEGKSINMFKK